MSERAVAAEWQGAPKPGRFEQGGDRAMYGALPTSGADGSNTVTQSSLFDVFCWPSDM